MLKFGQKLTWKLIFGPTIQVKNGFFGSFKFKSQKGPYIGDTLRQKLILWFLLTLGVQVTPPLSPQPNLVINKLTYHFITHIYIYFGICTFYKIVISNRANFVIFGSISSFGDPKEGQISLFDICVFCNF